MEIKMKVMAVVATLVVVLLLPGVSHALTPEQEWLVGLKGVSVVVPDIPPEAERLGLIKEHIKTEVELRLRKTGIRVLTMKEMLGTPGTPGMPGMPFLFIHINPIITKSGLCICGIDVDLSEIVSLYNGKQARGIIWSKGLVGDVNINNINGIQQKVGVLVDMFINDYLAANPKK
jgi:hypothetical protein